MSKELEALYFLLTEAITNGDGTNKVDNEHVRVCYDMLTKYLTPPTADEVCEALSKWIKEDVPDLWNYNVYYDDGGFHYYNTEDFETYLVEHDIIDKTISFSVYLPPHLITLIGRFYANEVKVK
jgi:hypothetical protein